MLCPMATGTLDSALGFGHSLSHPTTRGSIWERQARTAALLNTPENVTCLSPGLGHHHEMAFLWEMFPISHPQSSLDTDKLSRLGFVMLHSLALLVKRTFNVFFLVLFSFLLN